MELLNKRTVGIVLAGAIGLTAFGAESASAPVDSSITLKHNTNSDVESNPNGGRIVYLNGSSEAKSGNGLSQTRVYEYCNGHDLVQDPLGPRPDFSQEPVVSVNDPVCADGNLMPSDF